MKKYILMFVLIGSMKAFGADADTVTHKAPEPPVRLYYLDGEPIEPEWVPIIHEKDCNEFGWKFRGYEWKKVTDDIPEYLNNPDHGSNNGWILS